MNVDDIRRACAELGYPESMADLLVKVRLEDGERLLRLAAVDPDVRRVIQRAFGLPYDGVAS